MQNGTFLNITKFFLAGAALGGGVALLCAPQSGERTRRAIRRKAENVADAVRDAGGQVAMKYHGLRRGISHAWSRSRLASAA